MECPNEAYFLAKKIWDWIKVFKVQILRNRRDRAKNGILPHGRIVHVHPRLLVKPENLWHI